MSLLDWLMAVPVVLILGYLSFAKSTERGTLVVKWVFSVVLIGIICRIASMRIPLMPLFLLPPCVILGLMWASSFGRMVAKPIGDLFDGGSEEADLKPFYYIAEAKRIKGLFEEAIEEVRKQLELFPGDPEGMMKIAAIQAQDLHDLPAATATLNELLQQPGLPAQSTVAALQTLADWQVQLGRDYAAARATFERIIELFPDSPFSHTAQQRLAHLEGVVQAREFREHAVFKVPEGPRDLGLRDSAPPPVSPEAQADALAAQYVRQLESHPNDTDTREKLAMLYAGQFERLDLAVEQLEQLAAMPNETPQHLAHWLDLMATLHIRHGHDLPAAQSTLHRIIDRFPNTALASRAVARLASLEGELRAVSKVTTTKAIGVYEKDLGVKSRSGPRS